MLLKINSLEEYNAHKNDERVLIDFFATWCGPCRMLGPVLEEISESDSTLTILKIDSDEFPELAREYGVSAIPSLFFLKNGKIIHNAMGFMPKPKLEALIAEKIG